MYAPSKRQHVGRDVGGEYKSVCVCVCVFFSVQSVNMLVHTNETGTVRRASKEQDFEEASNEMSLISKPHGSPPCVANNLANFGIHLPDNDFTTYPLPRWEKIKASPAGGSHVPQETPIGSHEHCKIASS